MINLKFDNLLVKDTLAHLKIFDSFSVYIFFFFCSNSVTLGWRWLPFLSTQLPLDLVYKTDRNSHLSPLIALHLSQRFIHPEEISL